VFIQSCGTCIFPLEDLSSLSSAYTSIVDADHKSKILHPKSFSMSQTKPVKDLSDLYKLIPGAEPPKQQKKETASMIQKLVTLQVLLETKGRKGKGVTLIRGFHHTEEDLLELARKLKTTCGTGGTVKESTIELQGDHRSKVAEMLRGLGFTVKMR
jgi:translation initiation factor 1